MARNRSLLSVLSVTLAVHLLLCCAGAEAEASRLYFTTYQDEGTPLFQVDLSPSGTLAASDPVLVLNITQRIRALAVDGQTSTVYYAAQDSTIYAADLSGESAPVALFSGHNVRALRLVYDEDAQPLIYFVGCGDEPEPEPEQEVDPELGADEGVETRWNEKRDSCPSVLLWRMDPQSAGSACVVGTIERSEMDLVRDLDVQMNEDGGFTAFLSGRYIDWSQNLIWGPVYALSDDGGATCNASAVITGPLFNETASGTAAAIGDKLYGLFTSDDDGTTTLLVTPIDGSGSVVTLDVAPSSQTELVLTKDEASSTLYFLLGDNIVAVAVNGSTYSAALPRTIVEGAYGVRCLTFVRFPDAAPHSDAFASASEVVSSSLAVYLLPLLSQ